MFNMILFLATLFVCLGGIYYCSVKCVQTKDAFYGWLTIAMCLVTVWFVYMALKIEFLIH